MKKLVYIYLSNGYIVQRSPSLASVVLSTPQSHFFTLGQWTSLAPHPFEVHDAHYNVHGLSARVLPIY